MFACYTADRLTAQYGVSRETAKRDGQYATAVEKLGLEAEIASREVDLQQRAPAFGTGPLRILAQRGDRPYTSCVERTYTTASPAACRLT
jgi:hypothetical protein